MYLHTYLLTYKKQNRSTQPPTLGKMGNKYQQCDDALRLGSKGTKQVWLIAPVNKVWVSLTRAIPERLRGES